MFSLNGFVRIEQKHSKKIIKINKNAETRKKLLTNKNTYASMHKVAEGTTKQSD